MNRFLFLATALVVSVSSFAEWGKTYEDPISIFPTAESSRATDVKAGPDGTVWALIYSPEMRDYGDGDTFLRYNFMVQHFDREGKPAFPAEGLMVSGQDNWASTVVNNYLMVDSDGNAIVSAIDCRNSGGKYKSYTAYKVSPQGEMLWGEDGVAISDPENPCDLAVWMNMIELEDHSYVFAWAEYDAEEESHVHLQRVTEDGKPLWGVSKVYLPDEITGYPYLINSGDNTFIMVHSRTSSEVLYASKLDFECGDVWGKSPRIYRGGWGQVPLQTILNVKPSGDGGVLVAWTDDRTASNIESAYLSYVTADGELAFAGVSDEADLKLCDDDWRCFNLNVVPAADGSCFYAVWRSLGGDSQTWQALKMQKISKQGELLWGDGARDLQEVRVTSYGYLSLQQAGTDGACAFWQEYHDFYDQSCMAARFDSDGKFVWDSGVLDLSRPGRKSTDLKSQPMEGENAWLFRYCDRGSEAEGSSATYMMGRLSQDGTFGLEDAGVEAVEDPTLTVMYDGLALVGDVPDGTVADIYDFCGRHVAGCVFRSGRAEAPLTHGLYLARLAGADGRESVTVKFAIK